MAIIAKASGDGSNSIPAPAGVHQAVCVDVIDKGMVEVPGYDGKPPAKKHLITLAWQINKLRDDGKRFVLYRRYTLSLNEKAALRRDLESWRGRAFTREEEAGFDVENVIGKNCLINVQHNTKDAKTYANVISVMPLIEGMPALVADGYARESGETQDAQQSTQPPYVPPTDISADDVPF